MWFGPSVWGPVGERIQHEEGIRSPGLVAFLRADLYSQKALQLDPSLTQPGQGSTNPSPIADSWDRQGAVTRQGAAVSRDGTCSSEVLTSAAWGRPVPVSECFFKCM